jgi:hypothetical protein
VGLIATDKATLPEAGELAAIEALDRSGLLVTSEGALVRVLEAAPKNPLVMAARERVAVAEAFGQLVGRLRAGQSLQFYVEARPVQLGALVAQGRGETAAVAAALEAAGDQERAAALRRLGEGHERSLRVHSDDKAAVDVRYFVIVPYTPEESGVRVDWRRLLPGRRGRLASSPRARSLESHRRVVRESLRHTDAIRSDLDALDLSTQVLQGPDVAELVWRRFSPTSADRAPLRATSGLELLAELEAVAGASPGALFGLKDPRPCPRGTGRHGQPPACRNAIRLGGPPDPPFDHSLANWVTDSSAVSREMRGYNALSMNVHAGSVVIKR